MKGITAVILTKNEEKNIGACLQSLKFCDEIIVIDDFSTDETTKIAKENSVTVFQRKLSGDFSAQRNFGLERAKNSWIFFVDADERVSPKLQKEIEHIDGDSSVYSYYIPRRDWWWKTELKHGEVKKVREMGLIRLMKKGSGKWSGLVHEEFQTEKATGKLSAFLDHYPHQTLKEFLHEINMYSTLRAKELSREGKTVRMFSILAYPFFKFILVYFIYLGFLDGPAGFAYAFLMSFHSFLVRVKLYQYRNLQ